MSLLTAASQLGLLPVAIFLTGVYQTVRYLRRSKPLVSTDVWAVFVFAAALPPVAAVLVASLGNESIMQDTSVRTYLLLNSSSVMFLLSFWMMIFVREGWQSKTLLAFFKNVSVPRFFILRVLFGMLMLLGIMYIYKLSMDNSTALDPCTGRKCRSAELMLGQKGTILGPLFAFGVFNSILVGMMSAWLAKGVAVLCSAKGIGIR
jgi:hypothetical protein